jgi:type II secretory pathway pseudopilin PulG
MMKRQRGTSIPEILTVTVIIGMLLSAMVVIVPLLVKSPAQMQSQVDTVNTAAIALYRMRRDFSQGDTNGVLSCKITPVVSCSTPPAKASSTQALVVVTDDKGTGVFNVDANGYPLWDGIYIYWLRLNSTGTAYDLMRAYEAIPGITAVNGIPNNVNAALVTPFVGLAMAISPAPVLTNNIADMELGISGSPSTINFELIAGTIGGVNQTQTNFQGNTYARN